MCCATRAKVVELGAPARNVDQTPIQLLVGLFPQLLVQLVVAALDETQHLMGGEGRLEMAAGERLDVRMAQ